jgi:GR25 family glycosyltransferase involved in LPS biosynthesis
MKTLNDFFSKIYCINLDSRPDRYKQCLVEFEKLNIIIERISGIDGKKISNNNLKLSAGAYGLLLTNIKIINEAILNEYENVLILEDDVMFNNKFYEIFNEKILSLPNDWDLLFLGGSHVFSKGKFNLITGDKNFMVTEKNYKSLNYELCKTTWTQTTHAVAINFKFFNTLMNSITENTARPTNEGIFAIDRQYCELQQKGCNTYTFLPSLVLQRPNFSDIENIFIDYNKSGHFF